MPKIKNITNVGKHQTYDLEVDHPDHQFYLSNGALTSNSHAAAYAALSYQCAYLQTFHTDEWIASCLDHSSTEKGKAAGKEDPKAITIREAQKMGYKMSKADINKSSKQFVVVNKEMIPSFASFKYVGNSVVEEMEQFRPYTKFTDILLNPDGKWRHSKFNKRALSTLICLEAFDSLEIVGKDKLFKNYKQMYMVMIENYDNLKRMSARKKNNDAEAEIIRLAKEHENEPDWTLQEKIAFSSELAGLIDTFAIVSPRIRDVLYEKNIASVDEYDGKGNYWAIVLNSFEAMTKTGKPYIKLKVMADMNAEYNCPIWDYKGSYEDFKPYDIIVGYFTRNDYGLSVKGGSIRIVSN